MKKWFVVLLLVVLSGCATKSERAGVDVKKAAEANAALGGAYLARGQYEVALRKLNRALEYDEENVDAHHYLGELYRRVGDNDLAQVHYLKALELTPDNSALKNNYGVFLCSTESYEKAKKYFDEVLEDSIYKEKDQVYENIGLCALQKGNVLLAERNFEKGLKLNQNLPRALLGMAQIEFDKQHIKQATSYLNRYNSIAQHTAQSLWLGILIEKRNGNKSKVGTYSVYLKDKFPDSKETKLLKKMEKRRWN